MPKQLYIDGAWVPGAAGAEDPTYDPATEALIDTVARAEQSDVDAAVGAARRALSDPGWRDLVPRDRAALLFRLADLVEADADELARLETLDQGQPLSIARTVTVPMTADHFRYYAGWVTKIQGTVNPVSTPDTLNYTRREPIGVCGLITPWNFPLSIASWKLAPALATGNTTVLKPAEQTPLSTIRLVELAERAGFPRGVINLLTGDGRVGKAIVDHPGVDKISFTGSTAVGKEIARSAADTLKRVTLELGGKAPSIITRSADIDAAVAGNLGGALLNSGQVCAAYTRFYVDERRADEFVGKLAAGAAAVPIGPGSDPGTQMGPLVSAEHLAHVSGLVDVARQQHAEVVTGGSRARDKGWFYAPTVLTGVTDDMRIAREEVFGPVLSVLTYSDEDELSSLVARANDTDYGLAAAVWTQDLRTAHRLAEGIRAGSVFVNGLPIPDPAAPWGGFKSSGLGREMSTGAIDAFTEVKSVFVNLA